MKRLLILAAAVATAVVAAIVCLAPPPTTKVVAEMPAPESDSICGNGTVEPPEECDPPAPDSPQCPDWLCSGKAYCWSMCNINCKCSDPSGACGCVKGKCGCECEVNADCPSERPICTGMGGLPYCTCVEAPTATPTPTAPTPTPRPPTPTPYIGGIAEAPDLDTSALEATASGGSSGTTYAVIAGIAAGVALLGAGGWYARRRWRAG